MRSFLRKLTWWLERRRRDEDLRAELQFHLDEEAAEREAAGLSPMEAGWAARRDLGNTTLLREQTRTLWTWTPVEQLGQDIRFALRTMRRNRGFTAMAVLSLALGIGANTAIYSFMDAILLRPLPVDNPASLAELRWHSRPFAFGSRATGPSQFVMRSVDGRTDDSPGGGVAASIFPYPAFEHLRAASPAVFASLFAFFPSEGLNVMVRGEAERADAHYVSGSFFDGLGVSPAAGRLLLAHDDRAGAASVAVLSAGYAARRFGTGANAVGQPILINSAPFTVVGVTPAEFFGVDPGAAPDIYLPLHAEPVFTPSTDGNHYWLQMMGRLRPGVSAARAEAALAPAFQQWVAATATTDRERANLPVLQLRDGAGGLDTLRRKYSGPIYVLFGVVGLILAIACANTANLLLARATVRRQEMAVRLSVGAGRLRLIRQLLTESVLLASLGGVLGIGVATAGIRVLTRLLSNGQDKFTLHADLNWQVLAVTLVLSVACGVLFGLAPAIQSTRVDLAPSLKARGTSPRLALARIFVVAQIAISLVLLVAAGLFVRTLSNLQAIELGVDTENILMFEIDALQAGHSGAGAPAFYGDLRNRLAAMPGVRGATLSHASLLRAGRRLPVRVDNEPAKPDTRILSTGPAFFSTMGIRMVMGRELEDRDRFVAPSTAVVSERFARSHFGRENPLGRRVRVGGTEPYDLEIVGVASEAHYGFLKAEVPSVIYVPYAIPPLREMTYALRTEGDPLRQVDAVRAAVHAADPRVPVSRVRTLTEEVNRTINQEIVFARLCTAFALLALVIACVGLYGTMAYAVARRTREIGVRMALGAQRRSVLWMVLREVCLLTAVGLAISLPIALGSSRLVESFLYGMQPNDPRALSVAVAVLVAAAFAAGYGPAYRASRIGPTVALRQE